MGAIVCYDCTDEISFTNAETWMKEFRQMSRPNASIVLVANKIDLKETGA